MSEPVKEIKETSELEWINLNKQLTDLRAREKVKGRLWERFKQNPLVPIGALATTAALSYGLWSFRKGDQKRSQLMMRGRVAAQAFTIFALLAGMLGWSVTATKKAKE